MFRRTKEWIRITLYQQYDGAENCRYAHSYRNQGRDRNVGDREKVLHRSGHTGEEEL
jgi:hypothetical protein